MKMHKIHRRLIIAPLQSDYIPNTQFRDSLLFPLVGTEGTPKNQIESLVFPEPQPHNALLAYLKDAELVNLDRDLDKFMVELVLILNLRLGQDLCGKIEIKLNFGSVL